MITLDNKVNLTFSNMGLFDTESPWTHPVITIDSFELIFVTEGTVSLYEGEKIFELNKGEMILLFPGVEHGMCARPCKNRKNIQKNHAYFKEFIFAVRAFACRVSFLSI